MPQPQDLMGYGMPPNLAGELGNMPQALTCAGTTQTTAASILEHLVTLTASGGATGAILPVGKVGTPYYLMGNSGTAPKIYPPVGHSLNGTLNLGLTLSAGIAGALFIQMSLKNWASIPVAP